MSPSVRSVSREVVICETPIINQANWSKCSIQPAGLLLKSCVADRVPVNGGRRTAAFHNIDVQFRIKSTQHFQLLSSICSQDKEDQKRSGGASEARSQRDEA